MTSTSTTWGFPSLFCYAVMRRYGCPGGECYEYGLMKAQVRAGAGIFQCDEHAVLSQDKEMSLGFIGDSKNEVKTQWFLLAPVGRSADGFAANTELFMHVWEVIGSDGRWRNHDWTIKADPDAVVLPERVRTHLARFNGQNNYVPNCNAFPADPRFPMVYGSFEAFSKLAMLAYYNNGGAQRCENELQWRAWGEDAYMGECMKHLGVAQSTDLSILSDKRCGGNGQCTDGTAAAYHDFKTIQLWFQCWQQATGDAWVSFGLG